MDHFLVRLGNKGSNSSIASNPRALPQSIPVRLEANLSLPRRVADNLPWGALNKKTVHHQDLFLFVCCHLLTLTSWKKRN